MILWINIANALGICFAPCLPVPVTSPEVPALPLTAGGGSPGR